MAITSLADEMVEQWLELPMPEPYMYPDLASALASWIAGGCEATLDELATSIWKDANHLGLQKVI
jgi:hypothetical protein